MKRILVVMVAAMLVAPPVQAAEPPTALEASARASVLFAQIDVQPAFDPALADSRASASTIGTASLQSVTWPSFLVDAFFFLYGFQSVERVALGIAEARWPQGPTEADATQSDLLFLNAGDPDDLPGKGGRASAFAGADGAGGDVAWARVTLPGVGTARAVRSETSATTADSADSIATQEVLDVQVGVLSIDSILGTARTSSTGVAEASLVIAGARVAGEAVVIDDEGVRAQTDAAQPIVDAALDGSGLTVRLLPAVEESEGGSARASSGGVLVAAEYEAPDPDGTGTTAVTLGYILGAADASARAVTLDPVERPGGVVIIVDFPCVCPGPSPAPAPEAETDPAIIRRIVVTTVATGVPIGARGAYGAVMLLALAMIVFRPLVRAAART